MNHKFKPGAIVVNKDTKQPFIINKVFKLGHWKSYDYKAKKVGDPYTTYFLAHNWFETMQ